MNDFNAATPPQNGSEPGAIEPLSASSVPETGHKLIGVDFGADDHTAMAVYDTEARCIDRLSLWDLKHDVHGEVEAEMQEKLKALGISPEIIAAPNAAYAAYLNRCSGLSLFRTALVTYADKWMYDALRQIYSKVTKPFAPIRTASARKRRQRRKGTVVVTMTVRALRRFDFDTPSHGTLTGRINSNEPARGNLPKEGSPRE